MENYLDIRIHNIEFISNKYVNLHSEFKNQLYNNSIEELGFFEFMRKKF